MMGGGDGGVEKNGNGVMVIGVTGAGNSDGWGRW